MEQSYQNFFISQPLGMGSRRYGVTIKYFRDEGSRLAKRIDYEALLQMEKEGELWRMRLFKNDIFFNRHEPDAISEILATAISDTLYPVETLINNLGEQVSDITNHQEMLQRWQQSKQRIAEKYDSEVIEIFFKHVDEKISNKETVQSAMGYDMFWNLFFHPKYIAYMEGYTLPVDMYLSVIPYEFPVMFPGLQTIKPQYTDYNSIIIDFTSEERVAPNALVPEKERHNTCFMKLDVQFDLDAAHHFAMHTQAHFRLYKKTGVNEELIKRIIFTMYQLPTSGIVK